MKCNCLCHTFSIMKHIVPCCSSYDEEEDEIEVAELLEKAIEKSMKIVKENADAIKSAHSIIDECLDKLKK